MVTKRKWCHLKFTQVGSKPSSIWHLSQKLQKHSTLNCTSLKVTQNGCVWVLNDIWYKFWCHLSPLYLFQVADTLSASPMLGLQLQLLLRVSKKMTLPSWCLVTSAPGSPQTALQAVSNHHMALWNRDRWRSLPPTDILLTELTSAASEERHLCLRFGYSDLQAT